MNLNRRKSPIWVKCSSEEFKVLIADSKSFKEVLGFFGLVNKGQNYRTLKERMDYEGVDYNHLYEYQHRKSGFKKKIPLDQVLVEGSTYRRSGLKRRLIEEGLLEYKCEKCGLVDEWQDDSLVLVLDHINGVSNDNRLENLRFLCPNCNSQTKTFAGRNNKREPDPRSVCKCGSRKTKEAMVCISCSAKNRESPNKPPKEKLISEIETMSWCEIGRKYGVTDNAVRKWARSYSIDFSLSKTKAVIVSKAICECGNRKDYNSKRCKECYNKILEQKRISGETKVPKPPKKLHPKNVCHCGGRKTRYAKQCQKCHDEQSAQNME